MAELRPPAAPHENRALRLTFEYDGDQVTLVEQERVAMLAPPDDSEHIERAQTGYHVELRDAAGKPLYRRLLHAPMPDTYEVFSPEPGAPIRRVPIEHPHGRFSVVVPDVEGGASVVVVGPPAAPKAGGGGGPGLAARKTSGAGARTTVAEVRLGEPPRRPRARKAKR